MTMVETPALFAASIFSFMPPTGSPIAITGDDYTSVEENTAEVILPQACYNYEGNFTLAIKLVDSTNSDTSIRRNAIREQLKSYSKSEIEHMAQTAEYIQGYIDILDGKDTREAGLARLYEELREYNFAEIDKIYDALQRGEGGKVFTSKTHQATIKKGKLCVTTVS